jgi:hypothetical protein
LNCNSQIGQAVCIYLLWHSETLPIQPFPVATVGGKY